MKIAIYLAAHDGNHPEIKEAVQQVGAWMGEKRHDLVFGGSGVGLMLEIAASVKKAGGKLIGIQLQSIHEAGRTYPDLDELHLCKTLSERKQMMMDFADAFIVFPGGLGTLDELSDIISWNKLSPKQKPVLIYNLSHFYDDLEKQLDKMVEFGYLSENERKQTRFVTSLEEIETMLPR